MSSNADLVLNLASLTSHSMTGLNSDTSAPQARPGSLFFAVDAYGPRIFMYGRNRNGSDVTRGELMSYLSDTATPKVGRTTTEAAAAGHAASTTLITVTSLTAGDHNGALCYILNNDATAGALPEGETSIVTNNTATVVNLEADYAYSTDVLTLDAIELISNWQFHDATVDDEAWTVMGVVMGRDGISNGNYGWLQIEGICSVDIDTAVATEGDALNAAANSMADVAGAGGVEQHLAVAMAAAVIDQATQTLPALVKLFTCDTPASA